MSETRYLISEAAKLTDTDPHVLRYWEDELKLQIGRNQMGHRYYTGQDLHVFMEIKELKKQGLSLKAIRERIPALYSQETSQGTAAGLPAVLPPAAGQEKVCAEAAETVTRVRLREPAAPADTAGEKEPENMEQLADQVVAQACDMAEDKRERFNQILERLIDQVIQSEHQEARSRRLDEAIRRHQQSRKQVAATAEKDRGFGKRKKNGKK